MKKIVIFLFLICLGVGVAFRLPEDGIESEGDKIGATGDLKVWSSVSAFMISMMCLVVIITILFTCAGASGGCCGLGKIHWFGRSPERAREGVLSFDNPVANLSFAEPNSMPLSQIDARSLMLDPVIFEPLPTIHDISPVQFSHNRREEAAVSTSIINPNSVIIPFAKEDSELYAHDWFDYKNFQRNNLEFIREVGRGWFGEVLEADAKDIVPYADKIRVIVKRLRQDASEIEQMRFLDEARVGRDGNQGNVLKLLGHSIEKLPFLLIMEHFQLGDLKSYLIANVTRAESLSTKGTLLKFALDIGKGLDWMHRVGFKHSDLAARNCQVASDEGRIVIGDYGLATHIFKDDYYWNSKVPIPLRWAAPETIHVTASTIQTLKVSPASNVWSFSVVLWEIMEFSKLPYFELSDDEVITRVLGERNYLLGQPSLPYIPCKRELHELMLSCWNIDPTERPKTANIVLKLQALLDNVHTELKNKEEDFDLKWDQLGRLSTEKDKPRSILSKKSVSFGDGVKQLLLQEEMDLNKTFSNDTSAVIQDTEVAAIEDKHAEQVHEWMEDLEKENISQKIKEKSQSVQDLYQLTHVEPSDMHGPESLPIECDSISTTIDYPNESTSSAGIIIVSETSPSLNSFSSGANDSSESYRKTPREASKESPNPRTKTALQLPEICLQPSTPGTTPNKTGIDINLIEATPTPISPTKIEENQTKMEPPPSPEFAKKRIVFNWSPETPPLKYVRHTSTPNQSFNDSVVHTTSKQLDKNGDVEELSDSDDVFDSINSRNISLISVKKKSGGISPGEMINSIVVGASDDLGLQAFQGVTSQIDHHDPDLQDSFETAKSLNGHDFLGKSISFTSKREMENGSTIPTASNEDTSSWVHINNIPEESSEWDIIKNCSSVDKGKDAEVLNSRKTEKDCSSPEIHAESRFEILTTEPKPALNFTFTQDEGCINSHSKFVEDIQSANEECGSLILEDFEDNVSKISTVFPVSGDGEEFDINSKLAFTGEDNQDGNEELVSQSTEVEPFVTAEGEGSIGVREIVPSKWKHDLAPTRPAIKSPSVDALHLQQENKSASSLKKSVSFEIKKQQLVYQYPPQPPLSDDEDKCTAQSIASTSSTSPAHSSLDWELSQDDLEFAEVNPANDESDEDILSPHSIKRATTNPLSNMDLYRISAIEEPSFHVHASDEPFSFLPPSNLGELRHTRGSLKLDLTQKGEASLLDGDCNEKPCLSKSGDSGVGSSSVTPFPLKDKCDDSLIDPVSISTRSPLESNAGW